MHKIGHKTHTAQNPLAKRSILANNHIRHKASQQESFSLFPGISATRITVLWHQGTISKNLPIPFSRSLFSLWHHPGSTLLASGKSVCKKDSFPSRRKRMQKRTVGKTFYGSSHKVVEGTPFRLEPIRSGRERVKCGKFAKVYLDVFGKGWMGKGFTGCGGMW